MNEYTIGKLEEAFERWCTDIEACLHAGINQSTLYDYIKKNPKFSERKEVLKQSTIISARRTVRLHIEWLQDEETKKYIITPNPDIAMKYLERKKKDEFSTRTETTGKDWWSIEISTNISQLSDEQLLEKIKSINT